MDEKKIEKIELKIEELEERVAPTVTLTITVPAGELVGTDVAAVGAPDAAGVAGAAGPITVS